MKALRRITIGVVVGFLFTIGLIVATLELNEDKIVSLFSGTIENNLLSDITFSQVNISFIKSFPKASIRLHDVVIHSPYNIQTNKAPKTFLEAKNIYLEFSLLNIIQKNYSVENLSLTDGTINIFIDQQGNGNYNVFKKSSADKNSTLQFNFKLLELANTKFNYVDLRTEISIASDLNKLRVKGNILNQVAKTNIKYSGKIQYVKSKGQTYIQDLPIKSDFEYLRSTDAHVLKNIILQSKKNRFLGNIYFNTQHGGLEISASTQQLKPEFIARHIPVSFTDTLSKYTSKGLFDIQLKAIKKTRSVNQIQINSNIQVQNMNFKYNNVISGKVLSAGINYSNENGGKLIINSAKSTLDHQMGNINLNAEWQSLKQNIFNAHMHGTIQAIIVNQYLPEQIKFKTGEIQFNLQLKKHQLSSVQPIDWVRNADINIKQSEISYYQEPIFFNGDIHLRDFIFIDSSQITLYDNTFEIEAKLPASILKNDKNLNMQIKVKSDFTDVNQLHKFIAATNNEETENNNNDYRIALEANIKKLVYDQITLENFKTNTTLINSDLYFNAFTSDICNGNIKGKGSIVKNNNLNNLSIEGNIRHIDVQQLFQSFNNFHQSFITSENIRGYISGNIKYASSFTVDSFQLIPYTILAETDINIADGELVDFEPLYSLSKYVDMEELQQVRFSNLYNNIVIKNETVFLPEMSILSNAFNLNVTGKHFFDNTFDYFFNVDLSRALALKYNKKNKNENQFGYIVDNNDDRIKLPLRIYGNPENYQVKWDKKKLKQNFKESINKEKEEIKELFNLKDSIDETVETENDDTNNTEINQNEPIHRIEWDDE